MSLIEFQVDVKSFLAAQHFALRTMQLCPPGPWSFGPIDLVVDRIDFGPNSIRHEELTDFALFYEDHGSTVGVETEGIQTQIVQAVTVNVVTLNDIRARPNQAPLIVLPVSADLVFNFDFYTTGDECYFGIAFESFSFVNMPPVPPSFTVPGYPPVSRDEILQWLHEQLRTALPNRAIPAGFSSLTSIWAKFLNAGVSVDTALERIAFRAQIGGSSSFVGNPGMPWSNFLNGHFANLIGDADWGVSIDSGLITEKIKVEIGTQLDDLDVENLDTYVGCTYSAGQGQATFTTNVLGVYSLPLSIGTIVRDPHVDAVLSIVGENKLGLTANYGHLVETIHSFPIVEFLLPSLSSIIEHALQGVIDTAMADFNEEEDASYCKKIGPTLIECTRLVRPPVLLEGARAVIHALIAQPRGPVIVGELRIPTLSYGELSVVANGFGFGAPTSDCASITMATVAAAGSLTSEFAFLHAAMSLETAGSVPVHLCSWSVEGDYLNAFPVHTMSVDSGSSYLTLTIDMAVPSDAYYALNPPYPLRIMVRTTAGTRLLQVQPPPPITEEDIFALQGEMLAKIADCLQEREQLLRDFGIYEFDLPYAIQHSPRIAHRVDVAGVGITVGEALVLSIEGAPIAVSSSSNAIVGLSADLGTFEGHRMQVRRQQVVSKRDPSPIFDSSDIRGHSLPVERLAISHRTMEAVGELPVSGPIQMIRSTNIGEARSVIATLPNLLVAFDFTDPARPRYLRSWAVPGIKGVIPWRGNLIAYGSQGLSWVADEGNGRQPTERSVTTVHDVATKGSRLYAASDAGLIAYDQNLVAGPSLDLHQPIGVVCIGAWLVAAEWDRLVLVDVEAGDQLVPTAELGLAGIRRILRYPGLGTTSFAVLTESGSNMVLSVTNGRLEVVSDAIAGVQSFERLNLDNYEVEAGKNGESLVVRRVAQTHFV